MLSVARGMCRMPLTFFTQSANAGVRKSQLIVLAYTFVGYLNNFPIRNRFEVMFNYNPNAKHRYASFGWVPEAIFRFDPFFFGIGLGPTFKTGPTPNLGGSFLAHSVVSCGVTFAQFDFELVWHHTSNMYLSKPNKGADYVGLALTYHFQADEEADGDFQESLDTTNRRRFSYQHARDLA